MCSILNRKTFPNKTTHLLNINCNCSQEDRHYAVSDSDQEIEELTGMPEIGAGDNQQQAAEGFSLINMDTGLGYANLAEFRGAMPKSEVPLLFKEYCMLNDALVKRIAIEHYSDFEEIPRSPNATNYLEHRREEAKKWSKVLKGVGFEKVEFEFASVHYHISNSVIGLTEAKIIAISDFVLNEYLAYRKVNPMWFVKGAKVFC